MRCEVAAVEREPAIDLGPAMIEGRFDAGGRPPTEEM